MRLIDADALAEKLSSMHGEGGFEADIYCADGAWSKGKWIWLDPEDYGLEAAEKALKQTSTIDAVAVVRCKDCKHREELLECPFWLGWCHNGDDDYCSWGEVIE